ncbi:Mobile element protein [Serratia fonticola AU-AP2C]|nr:Mobile element protein [Serratia fonticola AU-AP2C]
MYAEERVKAEIIQEPWRMVVKLSLRKQMAQDAVRHRNISIRFACQLFVVSESCHRYQAKMSKENEAIADWLLRITDSQRSWCVLP